MDGQGIDLVEGVYRSIDPGVGLVGQQIHQTALLIPHLKKECQLSFWTYFAGIILFFEFLWWRFVLQNKTKKTKIFKTKSRKIKYSIIEEENKRCGG